MLVSSGNSSTMPQVFKENQGASIAKGEHARLSSFIGAIAIADLVKTTLGPKGMDKMLVSGAPGPRGGDVTVTNDGATILKKVPVDNPAAKVLVNISMTQDDEVGDGTTSVVVLAGELLREAEKLTMQKIHPQTIIRGWRVAVKEAISCLDRSAVDNKNNDIQFKKDLMNIAKTTLSSKIVTAELDFFAKLAVDAVLRLKGSVDLDMIQIVKKQGGSMKDSFLDDGFILDKSFGLAQPTTYIKPRIMVANTGMDTDKIKIWGAKVKVHSMQEVANIEQAEKEKMRKKVQKILSHNIDIFINRQLIYDFPEQLLTQAKVGSIEHADFEGVERLARVLGAEIMSTFDIPNGNETSKDNNNNSNNDTSKDNNNNDNGKNETNNSDKKPNETDKDKQDTTVTTTKTSDTSDNKNDNKNNNKNDDTTTTTAAATSASNNNNNDDDGKDDSKSQDVIVSSNNSSKMGSYLGTCEKVEEMMIGEDNVIKFSGVAKGEACTIVLRGASMHLLDEMERSLHDALCVLTQTVKQSKVVLGGGASEMSMAHCVEKAARQHSGKEALAMDAFANALRSIPTTLADNAGFDAAEIVTQLRAEHAAGKTWMGVDMETRGIGDMRERGVTEAYKSKSQSLVSAHEAAEMILRVDDIVKCAPRGRA